MLLRFARQHPLSRLDTQYSRRLIESGPTEAQEGAFSRVKST
jgi:hypothetical protein